MSSSSPNHKSSEGTEMTTVDGGVNGVTPGNHPNVYPAPSPSGPPPLDSQEQGNVAAAGFSLRRRLSASRGVGSISIPINALTLSRREHEDMEQKNSNTGIHQVYQMKAQELSLRINQLTARRMSLNKEGAGAVSPIKTIAIADPEALAADLASKGEDEDLETNVHFQQIDSLAASFHSNLKTGLSPEQVIINRKEYGSNSLSPPTDISWVLLFAQQLISGFNALLWIATIVIFISWQPLGSLNGLFPATVNVAVAALLLVVIFVQAIFTVYMVVGAINIVKSFSTIQPGNVRVRRNHVDEVIPAKDVVVGDLIYVELGQRIPADMRLVECQDLQVDNSALTGESEAIHCTTKCSSLNFMESTNMIFLGTACPQGSGLGLVVATGDQAVIGQINYLTQANNTAFETSLHREILVFVAIVAAAALTTGVVALIVWGAWLYQQHATFMPPAAITLNVISLIVAYVPEGLPVTVTLTLTMIAKRMYAQRVLVRNLAIIETFNSLSLIATDKTGTLTHNKMTITQIAWGQKQSYTPPAVENITNNPYVIATASLISTSETKPSRTEHPTTAPIADRRPSQVWKGLSPSLTNDDTFQSLLLGGALCNNSSTQISTNGETTILGDAADKALHQLLSSQLHLNPMEYRQMYPRINALPFNSKNKFMIAVHQVTPTATGVTLSGPSLAPAPSSMNPSSSSPSSNSDSSPSSVRVVCFLKGAPEIVLERCSSMLTEKSSDGSGAGTTSVPLTDAMKKAILTRQESMGRAGLRVIAMCRLYMFLAEFQRGFGGEQETDKKRELEGFPGYGYTFVGMFGLLDPPREEVADSITKAHTAGVRVAMLTGDHATTAYSIARQVNIIPRTVPEAEVYTLQLAQDELGRAVMQMIQNDKVTMTHVLGQAASVPPVMPIDGSAGSPTKPMINSPTSSSSLQKPEPPLTAVSKVRAYVKTHLVSKPIEPRIQTTPTAAVISGSDLRLFDDYLWEWALHHRYLVFARTSPEQKLKIVQEAQKRHEVVAVTGDGVNDAPALKKSDLGIAMQAGTDVAREAGDIVLLDNNFASIISALETGRVVSDNLKKVCLYLMVGGTYCEMWPVMVNVFFGVPLPLASFEMICVSIGTDILDALALVQEKPEAAIMSRPPIDRRTAHLVDWKVVVQAYGILGTICTFSAFLCQFWYYQSLGLHPDCLFFAWLYEASDPYTCSANSSVSISATNQVEYNDTAQSIYYVSLIIVNWFQMMATRTRYSSILQHNPLWGKGQNLWLFAAMGTGIGLAVFILNVTWFNTTFGTRPVPIHYVAPAIGFGALLLLVDELRKWRVRNHPQGFLARIAW